MIATGGNSDKDKIKEGDKGREREREVRKIVIQK
jgi:hypothetical protein